MPRSLLLLLTLLPLSACQSDQCARLCTRLSEELDACADEWNIDWAYLDASSPSAFEESCQTLWSVQRSDLEWRQRVEVEDQCNATIDIFNDGQIDCDALRQIYFYDPL